MKKALFVLLLAVLSTSAIAGGRHHGHGGHGSHGNNWVVPAIIGGAIGYSLSRPYYEPYYAPPPVYYTPPPPVVYSLPQVVQPTCTQYIYQDQFGNTLRTEYRCN